MPDPVKDDVQIDGKPAIASTADASSSPQPGKKSLVEDIQSDLANVLSKNGKSPVKEAPVAGEQEQTSEEENDDGSTVEETGETASESESHTEVEETEGDEPPKSRTAKRIKTLLDDRTKLKQENEKLKALALQRAAAAAEAPTNRPPEQTSAYWADQHGKLKAAGGSEDQLNNAALRYSECLQTEAIDRVDQARQQQQTLKRNTDIFVNSMFEINEDHSFLKPAENAFGFDLDMQSEMGKKMVELAVRDGVKLQNNPTAILTYAQRADAAILRQRLRDGTLTTETLKRKTAEATAKGLVPGTRSAPPPPKTPSAKLDDLEKKARSGDKIARSQLSAAAVKADLGL